MARFSQFLFSLVEYLVSAALFNQMIVFFTEWLTPVEEVSGKDASLDDALESQIRITQVGVLRNKYYINAAGDYDDWQDNLR